MKLVRYLKIHLNIWTILSSIAIFVILTPIFILVMNLFNAPTENWVHIKEFLLRNYIGNTLMLLFFTGFFTILIGLSLAWLVAAYTFPLKSFFKWGLILPLAIPPYIGAFTYHGVLNYPGVIQTTLRNHFNLKVNQAYFDIMTLPGAIFIFTILLFPYVYLITKNFLERQSSSLIENARLLGNGSSEIFFRIVLPISRISIVGGVSLVILEVLNDYGVVKYFGIQTFTTSIFQAWFGMGDLNSAIRLAAILMSIVFGALILEKLLRGRKKYHFSTTKVRPLQPIQLKGWRAWLVFSYFLLIFTIAFLIPFLQLVAWMLITYKKVINSTFLTLIWNSISVAMLSSFFIIIIALIIANFARLSEGIMGRLFTRTILLGYSIPGAVIAIGVITLFIALDRWLFDFYSMIGVTPTLILSLSIVMLIFAYIVRFLAIGFNSIEAGFGKAGKTFTEAARLLGMTITQSFFKIDLVMIKTAVVGGFILVFVEILKELPLTLILQPFNFYTLATKAFQFASDEMVQEAALPSLLIIVISGISIFFFHKVLEKEPS